MCTIKFYNYKFVVLTTVKCEAYEGKQVTHTTASQNLCNKFIFYCKVVQK